MARRRHSGATPPHLLLVAMHFPPSRASGAYRPLAMANHFASRGWRVTVVTVTTDFFEHITQSADPTLEGAVHGDVRVVRAPMSLQRLETDTRRFGYVRANFPLLHGAFWDWTERALYPDRYSSWLPGVVRAALRVHRQSPVSVVLATGNPWSAFGAAWVFGRLTRVPYVMDYRDSWTLDQFNVCDAFPPDHPAWAWERRLIGGASRIVFVNRPMRQWHAERYPRDADRMVVVENGWDAGLLGAPAFRRPEPGRPLRLGYVGTVTPQLPHDVTWKGWELAMDEPALAGATITLYGHLGFFARSVSHVQALLPLDGDSRVAWAGPVSKREVLSTYEELDILLMMIPSSPYVTGGKVYEYMASGRPIVAIHTPDTAASDPLRGYPLYFPVRELSSEAVRDALVAAATRAATVTEADFLACLDHARRFERSALLDGFDAELLEVVDA
jgi:glycosyltransferase involved in cell wall biosynthesis